MGQKPEMEWTTQQVEHEYVSADGSGYGVGPLDN